MFVDLFQDKRNFLSLYNALSGQNLVYEETRIEQKILKDTVYRTLKNDVSMLINDQLVVMVEQQSTINENMPLRCLMYIARLYEQIVSKEKRYYKTLQKIPAPQFYVLYNGREKMERMKELRLSDAYAVKNEKFPLEIVVPVLNINTEENLPALKKCNILDEYSHFIEVVYDFMFRDETEPFKKAIQFCIEHHILEPYLTEAAVEVENFLIAEYSYDEDVAMQKQESYEQGLSKGLKDGDKKARMQAAIIAVKEFGIQSHIVAEKYNVNLSELESEIKAAN